MAGPSTKFIETAKKHGFLFIYLDNPGKLNALTTQSLKELKAAVDAAGKVKDVKGIIITGKGKAFCSGSDLRELASLDAKEAFKRSMQGQEAFFAVENSPKPTLALIHGYCLGGGNELAMACDYRVASEDSVLGQPEARFGMIPGFGGTYRLPRLVGADTARFLISTGKQLTARQALMAHLVDDAVPTASLEWDGMVFLQHAIENHHVSKAKKSHKIPLKSQSKLARLEATEFSKLFKTGKPQRRVKEFLKTKSK